ncbi:MAG: glycosyltransferase [Dehalococcoidia bacterium]|nr:glycosyltransferase [Dehalococcoidia bacterium]
MSDAHPPPRISAVINTYNAESVLEACLESVRWCDEIVVVDMYSTDRTVEIARRYTDKIVFHPRLTHVEPAREFALRQATGDWIFLIDADERCPAALAETLREVVKDDPKINGVNIPIRTRMLGRWMEHSGIGPSIGQYRLFRPNTVRQTARLHKPLNMLGAGIGIVYREEIAIQHEQYQSIEEMVDRINRYTTIEAQALFDLGVETNWEHMVEQFAREFYRRYFEQEGYKDGLPGFIYAGMMGAYGFLMMAKLWDMRRKAGKTTNEAVPESMDALLAQLAHGAVLGGWQRPAPDPDVAPSETDAEADDPSAATGPVWARLGPNTVIDPSADIVNPDRMLVGASVQIGANTRVEAKTAYDHGGSVEALDPIVTIGDSTIIGAGTTIIAANQVTIGRNCVIGDNVTIIDYVAPEPDADHEEPKLASAPIIIEDFVEIGDGATIHPGVRIGREAAVEPGAVVTTVVKPFSYVEGAPARATMRRALNGAGWEPIPDDEDDDHHLPPSVTIVLPVANAAEQAALAVQAAQNAAGGVDHEVIVVDRGTGDDIEAALAPIEGDVALIPNADDHGFAAAINQAASVARGKYLAIVRPDTAPLGGWLAVATAMLENDDEIAMVAPRVLSFSGETIAAGGWIQPDGELVYHHPTGPRADWPQLVNFAPEAGCVIRLSALARLGGLDERYETAAAAVADFGLALRTIGKRVAYAPASVVISTGPLAPDPHAAEYDRRAFVSKWSAAA